MRSGKIDDPAEASRVLADNVEAMISKGTIRRLVLSNKTIAAYKNKSPVPKKTTTILLI